MKQHARYFHQIITNAKSNLTHITNTAKGTKFITNCNVKISENGRNGNVKAAETIFNTMSQKNIVTWTAMLTVYAQNGQIANARKLFDEMPERTTASYNAMISAYIRNGCNVTKAYEVFNSFHDRNAVSYAAMIMGFVKARKFHLAEKLYLEAPIEFRDPVCSNALINGYLKIGETNEALRVFENVGESERDVVSWSAVVGGLCRDGNVGYARILFDRMPERNVVSWSAMIDGYMEKGLFENGFCLFLDMRREGVVEVNSTTMTIMVKGCGNCGGVKEGMQIHGLVSRLGFEFGSVLTNTIITMYSLFGCTDMAKKVFCAMAQRITELEPANATPYVVLSNMYSAAGQKIEGDQSHRNIEEIKAIILTIDKGMQWLYYCDL
ncbi:hypothetical protein TSUD_54790 [Trifolium subterraneum]|uniref:Pentacotripeptide-repeat region of PRORP domain-containing protein n=1 Tax=Trifolium subterraneum TaxID=3900 RepID=A0A2Z6M800_TRISU|nr:hypothetical protein TSUD_54790 [Trifolium subterraneum]